MAKYEKVNVAVTYNNAHFLEAAQSLSVLFCTNLIYYDYAIANPLTIAI